MKSIVLTMPLPPVEFSMNSSSGRSWYAQRGRRAAKEQALAYVMKAVQDARWDGVQFEHPVVRVTFHLPTRHVLDHDSLVQRTKPLWDALSEPKGKKTTGLGVIFDDDLTTIGFPEYSYEYRKPGAVIIEIRERI